MIKNGSWLGKRYNKVTFIQAAFHRKYCLYLDQAQWIIEKFILDRLQCQMRLNSHLMWNPQALAHGCLLLKPEYLCIPVSLWHGNKGEMPVSLRPVTIAFPITYPPETSCGELYRLFCLIGHLNRAPVLITRSEGTAVCMSCRWCEDP